MSFFKYAVRNAHHTFCKAYQNSGALKGLEFLFSIARCIAFRMYSITFRSGDLKVIGRKKLMNSPGVPTLVWKCINLFEQVQSISMNAGHEGMYLVRKELHIMFANHIFIDISGLKWFLAKQTQYYLRTLPAPLAGTVHCWKAGRLVPELHGVWVTYKCFHKLETVANATRHNKLLISSYQADIQYQCYCVQARCTSLCREVTKGIWVGNRLLKARCYNAGYIAQSGCWRLLTLKHWIPM